MPTVKHLLFLGLISLLSKSAGAQTQQQNKQDSLVIANFNKKAKKEIVTTEYLREQKEKIKNPLQHLLCTTFQSLF